jgi:hypothetical protein
MLDDGVSLTENLRVSEAEAFYFGSVDDLDITSDGRMVVLDADAARVLKVLRPDGTLLDTLGRRGRGPGEFQGPTTVDVARGDSLYVFDNTLDRLSVFSPPPSSELTRSVVITSDKGDVSSVRALGARLVAERTPEFNRTEGLSRPPPNTWHLLDGTDVSAPSLLRAQRRKVAFSLGDQMGVIARLPFGRSTRVATGPDGRLYHGTTDSLRVRATSLDATTEAIATVPADPIPVTEAERDSVLDDLPSRVRRPIESAFPNTKPAFTDLVVAESGRLWVQRPPEGPDAQTTSWWVLDPDAQTVQTVRLDTDVTLEVVRDGRVYGTTTEAGAPAVVRYRIGEG